MFGYLTADSTKLSEQELARYKACYCGLCRSLGRRHGQLARLSLNYDMTFLVLLLSSLYEPEEEAGESSCLPHPVNKRTWWLSGATDYAADMNLALAYHKCLDDWEDDGKLSALAASSVLKGRYREIEKNYPRQCKAIADSMEQLHALEKNGSTDADACAQSFGRLMAEVLVWREDRWSEYLRRMGMSLGCFIYIMDAVMDLDRDLEKGSFNPLKAYAGDPGNEQRFRDIFKLLLGECLYCFDLLPLVQDTAIMKNILCAGLWAEFDKKYVKKESSDDSGSV